MTYRYAIVRGIHPRPEGVNFSVEVSFYPDTDIHPDLENIILTEWRVLRMTYDRQWEALYRQSVTNLDIEVAADLTGSIISPDGQRLAILFNSNSAYLIDIVNNQDIGVVPGLTDVGKTAVCDIRWVDNSSIVYNVGARTCDAVRQTTPEDAYRLSFTTCVIIPITEAFSGPAWVLPIPEAEVLIHIPLTANAGPNQTVVDIDNNGAELVTLDGSGSISGNSVITSYSWRENGVEIATGVTPTVNLPVGMHTITLTVTAGIAHDDPDW